MTKEEKQQVVAELSERLKETPNIYVANTDGLTVAEVNKLRKLCFDAGVTMQVVKNTLLKKALEDADGNYEELYPALKQQSSVFFVGENLNVPAKIIKKFREGSELPVLKGAFVGEAVYLGDDSLKTLESIKSKDELVGEIITLLQSPAKNVISALKSGGSTIAGIIKTLSEKEA